MVNCLAAPFAAAIEWVWLDTRLSLPQVLCGLVILAGVGLSLAPEGEPKRRLHEPGVGRAGCPQPAAGAPGTACPAGLMTGERGLRAADASRAHWAGILFGVLAGFGQGLGAVLTRKAFSVAQAGGFEVDGGTAAYQRILGGLAFVTFPVCLGADPPTLARRPRLAPPLDRTGTAPGWGWVMANALAGPSLGVAFYQWALKIAPAALSSQ